MPLYHVLWGDFNVIRKSADKNKPGGYNHWSFVFNAIIEQDGLRELPLNGRNFTWANNLPEPTYEKLDRILIYPDCEDHYPLTEVYALERELSDHTPLILDTGENTYSPPIFRFENSWMMRDGFKEFVIKIWSAKYHGDTIEQWQRRMRVFRQKVRGWILNSDAWYRKIKKEILMKLDATDKNAEIMGLFAHDREEQRSLRSQLHRLLKQEEMKWLQRYKDKEIKDGDCNTKYYHAKVNERRIKTEFFP